VAREDHDVVSVPLLVVLLSTANTAEVTVRERLKMVLDIPDPALFVRTKRRLSTLARSPIPWSHVSVVLVGPAMTVPAVPTSEMTPTLPALAYAMKHRPCVTMASNFLEVPTATTVLLADQPEPGAAVSNLDTVRFCEPSTQNARKMLEKATTRGVVAPVWFVRVSGPEMLDCRASSTVNAMMLSVDAVGCVCMTFAV